MQPWAFLSPAVSYPTVEISPAILVHSPIGSHLGYFQFLVILVKDATNILVLFYLSTILCMSTISLKIGVEFLVHSVSICLVLVASTYSPPHWLPHFTCPSALMRVPVAPLTHQIIFHSRYSGRVVLK